MHVAILCPGPSLNRFLSAGVRLPDTEVRYIGVNRAVQAWACHYWSFGDLAAFRQFKPLPLPERRKICLFTAGTHLDALIRDKQAVDDLMLDYEPLSYELVCAHVPSEISYRNYTVLASLLLAEWLLRGATEKRVRLYGADMSGLAYYDGAPCTGGGEETYRWGNESFHLMAMTAYLMGRGVIVEREEANAE